MLLIKQNAGQQKPRTVAHVLRQFIAQSRCETGMRSREVPRRTRTVRRGSERRACPPKARRSSESAIAAEALMNNAGWS
jgi:hypothetical protein